MLAAFVLLLVWLIFSKEKRSTLLFSNLGILKQNRFSLRQRWSKLPEILFFTAFGFLLLAIADPRIMGVDDDNARLKSRIQPVEGAALYLLLDQSGSMKKEVAPGISRLDAMKEVAKKFIEERKSDLIGLVSFARTAHILSPLTLDHEAVLKRLNQLQVVQTQEGTAIGYAIYKTAGMIEATKEYAKVLKSEERAPYEMKAAGMILVTDGYQFPHPDDLEKRLKAIGIEEAAEFAREREVNLYLVSIDPNIQDPDLAPLKRQMERAAMSTGGRFFHAKNSSDIEAVFKEIDQIEQSILGIEHERQSDKERRLHSYAPFLITVALGILFSAIALEGFWLRRRP